MGQSESAERLDRYLLPYITSLQDAHPDRLLMRGKVCNMAAERLAVSRPAVSGRIAIAAATPQLLEIFPRSDWLVTLPEGDDLPPLYAVPDPDNPALYALQRRAPSPRITRGAGGVSFLTNPTGLKRLLTLLRKEHGLPEPDGVEYYKPAIDRRVRPADYEKLRRILLLKYPEAMAGGRPEDVLDAFLEVLRLEPPATP